MEADENGLREAWAIPPASRSRSVRQDTHTGGETGCLQQLVGLSPIARPRRRAQLVWPQRFQGMQRIQKY
jgi:hypothetical protein